jgi:hypothetical protein
MFIILDNTLKCKSLDMCYPCGQFEPEFRKIRIEFETSLLIIQLER